MNYNDYEVDLLFIWCRISWIITAFSDTGEVALLRAVEDSQIGFSDYVDSWVSLADWQLSEVSQVIGHESQVKLKICPSVCLPVLCRPLTGKWNTVQLSNCQGRLLPWGVTGRAVLRSRSWAEMWKSLLAYILAKNVSVHIEPIPWWPLFVLHTFHPVQCSSENSYFLR